MRSASVRCKLTSSRVSLHQMGHRPFGDTDPAREEGAMHFWPAAVLTKTPVADQRNHIQTKLAMGQRPTSFLLWSVGDMVAWAVWLVASSDNQGQVPYSIESDDFPMGVVIHPERLTTLLAGCSQRRQGSLFGCFRAWSSSSHARISCSACLPPVLFSL